MRPNELKELCIKIAPQCKHNQHPMWEVEDLKRVKAVIDYEKTQLRIDDDRVYITGGSMGGFGTYDMADLYPKLFAAGVPLGLARSYISSGLKAKATAALKELVTKYPKTQAAKGAAVELEKLGKL